MRSSIRLGNLSLALAALLACALHASAQTQTAGGDDAAIRENVRQMESGWNSKSGAAFAKPFAADADYVVINGMQIKGRDAIAESHQRIFDTFYKDSVISLSVKQARMLRADVAVVHVSGHLKSAQGESDAVITLVMTKENGAWKIAAFQNTSVATGRN